MTMIAALLLLAPVPVLPPGATPPVPTITPFDAINPEDFPADADPDDSATIYVRLDIDASGRITDCQGLRTEAQGRWTAQQFLGLTCKLLRERVRFAPARDASGRPIASVYADGIVWDRVVGNDGKLIKGPPPVRLIWPREAPAPPAPLPPKPRIDPRPAMPKGNSGGWFSAADYPATLKSGESGRTHYRLTIGPDGRVTACSITKSSGFSLLDERTCSLVMRRARFSPAVDSQGNTISGTWSGSVVWNPPLQ